MHAIHNLCVNKYACRCALFEHKYLFDSNQGYCARYTLKNVHNFSNFLLYLFFTQPIKYQKKL